MNMISEEIEYNDDLWLQINNGKIIIGVKSEVVDEISELWGVDLPEEGAEVSPEEVCGEVETDQGPINIYSPVVGSVFEANTALKTDGEMLLDDPTGDGWLIKIEPDDESDLDQFFENSDNDTDEDE